MAGRDRLDVALFQRSGVVEPRSWQFPAPARPLAAISRGGWGCERGGPPPRFTRSAVARSRAGIQECALIRGFAAVEDARAADPIRCACAFRFPARADPGRSRTLAPR